MKLLSICFNPHDFNMCYYDGMVVRYFKSERYTQIKHHRVSTEDEIENLLQKVWGITSRDVDQICSTPFKVFNTETIEHHKAHMLSMQLFCETDVSIVFDGEGDKRTWSVYSGESLLDCGLVEQYGSIGHGIVALAQSMGIKGNSLDVPGKFMGLQSYGTLDQDHLEYLQKYDITQIGSSMKRINGVKEPIFHTGNKLFELDYDGNKLNLAKTIHTRCGEIIVDLFKKYAKPNDRIAYSGGVVQNVIWNTELRKHFKNLVVMPHCGDEGLSFGAMEYLRRKNSLPKLHVNYFQSDEALPDTITKDNIRKVAQHLANGKIVAWYHGNGEIGPRALGNRSILMDPRIHNGKEKINRIKNRESYRPFGGSILAEYAQEYFNITDNPYMLYVGTTQKENLQAITHIDGTCRIQTVDSGEFKHLLECFHDLTGCPVLLNTSLNKSGKPIAGSIRDAVEIYATNDIDVLSIGNKIFEK